jgi:phosphohistidine phosphatase SixA
MNRRAFVTIVGGSILSMPLTEGSQQTGQEHSIDLPELRMASASSAGADEAALWIKLRSEPHLVVFMRHTQSRGPNALTWDESGNCRGEVVLSEEGKAHAKKIGDAFIQHGVKPIRVISSPMCRCRETARIAFGSDYVTDALLREIASADSARTAAYEKTAISLIVTNLGNAPVVFVSHAPNINLLTLELIAEGDLLIGRANQNGEIDVVGKIRLEP